MDISCRGGLGRSGCPPAGSWPPYAVARYAAATDRQASHERGVNGDLHAKLAGRFSSSFANCLDLRGNAAHTTCSSPLGAGCGCARRAASAFASSPTSMLLFRHLHNLAPRSRTTTPKIVRWRDDFAQPFELLKARAAEPCLRAECQLERDIHPLGRDHHLMARDRCKRESTRCAIAFSGTVLPMIPRSSLSSAGLVTLGRQRHVDGDLEQFLQANHANGRAKPAYLRGIRRTNRTRTTTCR